MKKVTIWGLKNTRHSHRFIHKGFYENFLKLGYDTNWVNDSPSNEEIKSDIFFVSGMASQHIKFRKNSTYILHNVNLTDSNLNLIYKNKIRYLNLQVYTKDANGEKMDNSNILYNNATNTLFQPWGTPLLPTEWLTYSPKNESSVEWWVGAVWNNALNQGNVHTLKKYRRLLLKHNIFLIKRGGSRLKLNGVSDSSNSRLIRKSRLGATIVGEWQYNSSYIPCRLFKNLSFGLPPLSNMLPPESFSDKSGFISDLEELVDFALFETEKKREARFKVARNDLEIFTYEKNIQRILKLCEMVN
jgi:hypothetical protein